jgi:hypothetical protein
MNDTTLATTSVAGEAAGPVAQRRQVWKRATRLGGRSLASIGDQGATAAINFVSSIFIGRLIGAEALGIFAMTSVLVMAIRQLQGGAVLEPMSVFGPRRSNAERGGYLGFVVGLQRLWVGGISAVITVGCIVWWLAGHLSNVEMRTVVAGMVFANLVTFQYLMRRQFYVDQRPYSALVQSLAYLGLSIAMLAIYSLSTSVTLVGMYLVLTFSSLIVCVIQGRRLWHEVGTPSEDERRSYARDHWKYGRWALLTLPVGIAYYQGYFLLCGSLMSAQDAGYLKAVDTFIAPFSQVAIGLSLMFVPMLARRYDDMSSEERSAFTRKMLLGMLSLSAVYAAAVYFLGPMVLRIAYGENLAGAAAIIGIMAIIPLSIGIAQAPGILLVVQRRSDLRLIATCVAAVMTFAVGVPLILNFGLQGAALGMCLSQAVFAAALWVAVMWQRSREDAATASEAVSSAAPDAV